MMTHLRVQHSQHKVGPLKQLVKGGNWGTNGNRCIVQYNWGQGISKNLKAVFIVIFTSTKRTVSGKNSFPSKDPIWYHWYNQLIPVTPLKAKKMYCGITVHESEINQIIHQISYCLNNMLAFLVPQDSVACIAIRWNLSLVELPWFWAD